MPEDNLLTLTGEELEALIASKVSEALLGDNGPQGPRGNPGEVGPQGDGGLRGDEGDPGRFTEGADGPRGPQGIEGPQGLSGPRGPRGYQGLRGQLGPQGLDGVEGPQGERGPKGDRGDQGNRGEQGASISIKQELDSVEDLPADPTEGDGYLIDGDLWIYDANVLDWLNVGQIQGPQGPQGIKGDKGDRGEQGLRGLTGDQGPQGLQGPIGPEGEVGPKGDRGEKGDQGDAGLDGIQLDEIPDVTQSDRGLMIASDKRKLDGATNLATADALARRNGSGQISVGDPTHVNHVASMGYVDSGDAGRFPFRLTPTSTNVDEIIEPGQYAVQTTSGRTNHPISAAASLEVIPFATTTGNWIIQRWTSWVVGQTYTRASNDGGATWKPWREHASTDVATGSSDGLMSSDDKTKLDEATHLASNDTLFRRSQYGYGNIRQLSLTDQPSVSAHATRKDYVDDELGKVLVATEVASGTNLDTYTTSGVYIQSGNVRATLDLNYPVERAGLFEVHSSPSQSFTYQRYTPYRASGSESDLYYSRSYYNNAWSSWKQVATADTATTSRDGLMSSTDKSFLNSATTVGKDVFQASTTSAARTAIGADQSRSTGTLIQLRSGTSSTAYVWSPKVLADYSKQNSMQIVNHGSTASTARPSGAIAVYWIGSVAPSNAQDNDIWRQS